MTLAGEGCFFAGMEGLRWGVKKRDKGRVLMRKEATQAR